MHLNKNIVNKRKDKQIRSGHWLLMSMWMRSHHLWHIVSNINALSNHPKTRKSNHLFLFFFSNSMSRFKVMG